MTTPAFVPSYNGTFNATDHLVAPWWVPGWTSQVPISINANNQNLLGPGFPSNLSFVNIQGNYFDTNGSGIGGFITVRMSTGITVVDGSNTFRLPARLTGSMLQPVPFSFNNWGSGRLYVRLGFLNIEVFATDQTASGSTITTDTGIPLFYYVTEHWLDGRTYHIQVPSASAPGPVDINSLIVPGTIESYQYDPVFPSGNMWTPELDTFNTIAPYSGI